jgi:hypothetical protein
MGIMAARGWRGGVGPLILVQGSMWLRSVLLRVMSSLRRCLAVAAAMAGLLPVPTSFAADAVEALLRETHWGESSDALLPKLGVGAKRLPRPFDFGDSYADLVLEGDILGGVPVVVFFQMDKATHRLKRVQLQPVGHQLDPPAFRAIVAALDSELGRPDQRCVTSPVAAAGYQAAVEERWMRPDAVVSAIFRDTTLQAFEGCLYGPASGWCGLHGQLLVRIAPPGRGPLTCGPGSLGGATTARRYGAGRS